MTLRGILSDAHGNIDAFDAAVAALRHRGALEYVFLGDAIGYLPSAEVVHRLRAMGNAVRCVLGNHESLLLGGGVDDERDRVYQLSRVKAMLSASDIGFIAGWSPSMDLPQGRFRVRFVHGSPTDPTHGYVYPDTNLAPFGAPSDYLFMGNSHHPFVRRSSGCCFVNVGSCGLPRDHGGLGSAALFDDESGAVEIYRFDIEAANAKAVRDLPGLHPSVVAVMSRRKDDIYGTRI